MFHYDPTFWRFLSMRFGMWGYSGRLWCVLVWTLLAGASLCSTFSKHATQWAWHKACFAQGHRAYEASHSVSLIKEPPEHMFVDGLGAVRRWRFARKLSDIDMVAARLALGGDAQHLAFTTGLGGPALKSRDIGLLASPLDVGFGRDVRSKLLALEILSVKRVPIAQEFQRIPKMLVGLWGELIGK